MATPEATFELVDDDLPNPQAARRLERLRKLAWWLDRSIGVGDRRIGIDPIIGLIPGVGDWIAALLSLYVLYEAATLGLPLRVLAQMGLNVLLEAVVGSVPVAGDLFDFVWQANMRNVRLVEQHYHARLKPRPIGRILLALAAVAFVLFALLLYLTFTMLQWIWGVLSR